MSKRPKYGNTKVVLDGITFDSKNEAARYGYLRELEDAGVISNLRRQVEYELIPRQTKMVVKQLKTKTKMVERLAEHPVHYRADFVYDKGPDTIVEDVKGSYITATPDFRIKKKLMLYVHGIEIHIINNPKQQV